MLLIKALKPLVEVIRQELDAIGELLRVRHHPYLVVIAATYHTIVCICLCLPPSTGVSLSQLPVVVNSEGVVTKAVQAQGEESINLQKEKISENLALPLT